MRERERERERESERERERENVVEDLQCNLRLYCYKPICFSHYRIDTHFQLFP